MNMDLASLNPPQKEAVLDFEHPLLVLAGAGSGKTRVITSKIVYAIEKGYEPWQILAVTFTNKAAGEMRTRVEDMLPDVDTGSLLMKTFHAFGAWLLRKYGERIGLGQAFTIYDDEDSLALLSTVYPDENKKDLKRYIKEIAKLKDKGKRPEDVKAFDYQDLPAFISHFEGYEAALSSSGCVDFADLIVRASELLSENPDIAEKLQNRFRLILVDEYQDSNAAQFRFLYELVGPRTQICVVGDDDQSIYRFRGAEIKNILSFPDQFPGTRVIKLEQNYRSSDAILRIAQAVISHNKERHPKTLWTEQKGGRKPVLINASNALDEATQIASAIQADRNYDATAVLYRTNMQSQVFEQTFKRYRIPYKLVGALSFYDREEIKDSLAWLSLLVNANNEVAFRRMINKPSRGIGKAAIEKIVSAEGEDCIKKLENAVSGRLLGAKARDGASAFLSTLVRARECLHAKSPLQDVLSLILSASGLDAYYDDEDDVAIKKARLENLAELGNVLSSEEPGIDGLLAFLERIMLDSTVLEKDEEEKDGVTLITMHNTKGLEFDRVFVSGLEDELIPGRNAEMDDETEEERRIFYVAVTRARKELYLSWAGSRMSWGETSTETPSRFLKEIPPEYLEGKLSDRPQYRYGGFAFTPRTSQGAFSHTPNWGKNIIPESVKVPPQKKVEVMKKLDLSVGDRIRHPEYGTGNVIEKDYRYGKEVVRIQFEDGRTAVFNTAFAKLEKL